MSRLSVKTESLTTQSDVPLEEQFSAPNRRRMSGPGMRTFQAIADLWGMDEKARLRVLGFPSRSVFFKWTKAAREHEDFTLPADVLLRISAVLGIHKALQILFQHEADGLAWLRKPHQALPFGDKPPLQLATSGTQDGLMLVRRFLDAARGGLYMAPNEIDTQAHVMTEEDIIFV